MREIWRTAFSVVSLHIANIFVSLLCANHVTRTFGKGIMPRRYRLNGVDVQDDAEKIFGTLRRTRAGVRPKPSHSSTCATFREDKVDVKQTMDGVPVSLRPGHPPCLTMKQDSRKLDQLGGIQCGVWNHVDDNNDNYRCSPRSTTEAAFRLVIGQQGHVESWRVW